MKIYTFPDFLSKQHANFEPLPFSLKPDTSLIKLPQAFFIPEFSNNITAEAGIAIKISKVGKNIQQKFAHRYITEIAPAIDFCANDAEKKNFNLGRCFDSSLLIGASEIFETNQELYLYMEKNLSAIDSKFYSNIDIVFSLIEHLSKYFTLKIGDSIYLGSGLITELAKNDAISVGINQFKTSVKIK